MNVAEATVPACVLASGIAGGVAGHGVGVWWSIAGSALGIPVGLAAYFAVTVPYVHAMIDSETAKGPPSVFKWLFLPAMGCCFALSVLANWFLVRWLAG